METNETALSPLRAACRDLKPVADRAIAEFYRRLLAARPEFAPYFAKTDWPKQRRMLLSALVLAIENVEEPDEVQETLRGFGRAHDPFHLSDEDYRQFGEILRDALADAAGESWNEEVDAEWAEAYTRLVHTMLGR